MKIYFDKINKIRREKGLSIEGLCKLTGITRTSLWRWEKEKQIPSEMNMIKLAQVLDVSVREISDMKDLKLVEKQNFSNAVDSWKLLGKMDYSKQKDKFDNILNELNELNSNVTQTKIIINALKSSIDIIFYIKDSNLKYLIASNSFIKNLNLNNNYEVFGKSDFDFFSKQEAERNNEEDKEILKGNNSIVYKEGFILGSRKKKWALIKKQPVMNSETKIVGVIGIYIDISDKKTVEEKRDILVKLLDKHPFIIGVLNLDKQDGEILYINDAVENKTGYSKEEFQKLGNRRMNEMYVYPPDMAELKLQYSGFPEKFPTRTIIRMMDSENQTFWVENIADLITHNNKKYGIGINRDCTFEKQSVLNEYVAYEMLDKFTDNENYILWSIQVNKRGKLKLLYLSNSFDKITGYKKVDFTKKPEPEHRCFDVPYFENDKLHKKTITDIIHPDYKNLIKRTVKCGKTSNNFKFKIITANNKILALETNASKKEVAGLNTVYFGRAEIIQKII
jgi:PAS domain S-box-containing protein